MESDTKTAVVFVHGIVGNPEIFDFLREIIPEGVATHSVSLAGHGGNALDFSKASMSEWKAQTLEAVKAYKARGFRVMGVGHSMGCLLLMEVAAPSVIDRLFLMNPPLRISLRSGMLKNALKVATGRWKSDAVARAAHDAYGISIDLNPLHYYGWPMRYAELFAGIARVRRRVLPALPCPVSAVLSARDEMVSPISANYLPDATILPDSTHYYYAPTDRETICREFTRSLHHLINI